MSRSNPGSQATLEEFESADRRRCKAIAEYASRRCQNDALRGVPYCADHFRLLDEHDETTG